MARNLGDATLSLGCGVSGARYQQRGAAKQFSKGEEDMAMELKTQVLFALIFLIVMTLIIFKKEIMEFLREKTGIGSSRKDQEYKEHDENKEDDSAG